MRIDSSTVVNSICQSVMTSTGPQKCVFTARRYIERGIAVGSRQSVVCSVGGVDCEFVITYNWDSRKVISRINSAIIPLLGVLTASENSKGNFIKPRKTTETLDWRHQAMDWNIRRRVCLARKGQKRVESLGVRVSDLRPSVMRMDLGKARQ